MTAALARASAPSGPRAGRVGRLAGPVAVAAGALAAAGIVGAVDPNEPGHYPTCPFLWATGLFCPGCGALRTMHALVHLDVASALTLNVLVVACVPLLAAWWVRWSYRQWTGRPRRWVAPAWSLWTLLVVVVAFGVLRNVPGFEALAP